jgi:hypothetical protein
MHAQTHAHRHIHADTCKQTQERLSGREEHKKLDRKKRMKEKRKIREEQTNKITKGPKSK